MISESCTFEYRYQLCEVLVVALRDGSSKQVITALDTYCHALEQPCNDSRWKPGIHVGDTGYS